MLEPGAPLPAPGPAGTDQTPQRTGLSTPALAPPAGTQPASWGGSDLSGPWPGPGGCPLLQTISLDTAEVGPPGTHRAGSEPVGLPGSQGHEGKGHDPALWAASPLGGGQLGPALSLSLPRTLTPHPKGFPAPADPRSGQVAGPPFPPPPQEATQLEVRGLRAGLEASRAGLGALEGSGRPQPSPP